MADAPDRVEVVRKRVREALASGVPVTELMRLTDLSDGAIYLFTQEGSTTRPYPRTLSKYEEALSRLAQSQAAGSDTSLGVAATEADETVPVSRVDLAYWRGRFDTLADWAHAIDGLMQQQRDQFTRFTRGVTDFRDSPVLVPLVRPGPPPDDLSDLPPEFRPKIARIYAAVAEEKRLRLAAEAEAQSLRQANGGRGGR